MTNAVWLHLYEASELPNPGGQTAGGLVEEEEGEGLVNGCKVSIWDDDKVLDIDGGDGCTTMQLHLIQLNSTLKHG